MFMVLSSWQSHCESSPGSFDECSTAPSGRRPKTKPDDLGCESACTGCQSLDPPSPYIVYVGILRYVKYSVYSTPNCRLAWWYYAALQSYSLGSIPSAVILFFFGFSIYFVSTTKSTSYIFIVLCHLFS